MRPILKHCPFCGSPAKYAGGTAGDVTVDAARCPKSECPASFKAVDVEIWNTRADFRPGDTVRLKKPDDFIEKFRDRDCIIERIGPDSIGQFKGEALVRFLKRKGRGKEWTSWMRLRDLVRVDGAE